MNVETMMSLEAMIIIALFITAVGALTAKVFRRANSPYILTITGTRSELIISGAMLCLVAIGLGVAALLIVSSLTSAIVGLAIFFGIEAVALDICANRTRFVRVSKPVMKRARTSSTNRL